MRCLTAQCTAIVAEKAAKPLFFKAEGYAGTALNLQRNSVYAVTNLADSGPGSLAAAPASSYVIFPNLSGTLAPSQRIQFRNRDIWVLGQTSPSGIQLRGGSGANHEGLIDIRADGHIWQHIRSRPDGPATTGNCCHGPFIFHTVKSGWLDHCSLYWGDDDCLDIFESDNITVSDCLIAEGLATPASRARGSIASRGAGISYLRTLFAMHDQRGPLLQDIASFDVLNCVAYNMTRGPAFQARSAGLSVTGNYEACVQILGPNGNGSFWQNVGLENTGGGMALFRVDNKVLLNYQDNCQNAPSPFLFDSESSGGALNPAPSSWLENNRHVSPRDRVMDVCDVVDYVLTNAGASHHRDSLDIATVSHVRNNTGVIPAQPGPWPVMSGGSVEHDPWDANAPDYLSDAIKIRFGIIAGSNTTQTFENGGNVNDFLYIMNQCFGL